MTNQAEQNLFAREFEFVKRLHDRTMEDKIAWQPTAERDVFQAAFPNYVVKIAPKTTEDEDDWTIQIFNTSGILIETLWAELLRTQNRTSGIYNMFTETWTAARRKALGATEALDELLVALGAE